MRETVATGKMSPQGCVRKDVSARMCPQGGCLGRASLSTSRYSQRHLSDEGSMLQFQGSGRRFIPRHLIFGKHVAWESTLFRKARYSRKHVAQRMDFSSERQRRRNGQGQAPVRVLRMCEGAVNPPALAGGYTDSFAVRSRTRCEASLPEHRA